MNLNSKTVNEILLDCLYKGEELIDGKAPSDFILVEGIMNKFGFHPGRVESHKDEIITMLRELPDSFHVGKGGGQSFLNMCEDRHGNQWTDFHRIMGELVALGMAIGKVKYCLPRDMWHSFPGGMPYIQIDIGD